jgi:hypothetical protein
MGNTCRIRIIAAEPRRPVIPITTFQEWDGEEIVMVHDAEHDTYRAAYYDGFTDYGGIGIAWGEGASEAAAVADLRQKESGLHE